MKVICKFNYAGMSNSLTNNKIYDAVETPAIIDPMSFRQVVQYIITCDDGCARAFPTQLFILLDEIRNEKIDQIVK